MHTLFSIVDQAKTTFRSDISRLLSEGGITKAAYVRWLSFQYHLTKGVQKHFLLVAAHPTLAGRRVLRDFLYGFGLEEEPHFDIARKDLEHLGTSPLPCPLDVTLWWSFFDEIVTQRPFVRLGATCVLENLGAGAGELGHQLFDTAEFLNPSNTRFFNIHFHEALPHGDQIFAALQSVPLSDSETDDLAEGAKIGSIIYLRLSRWAMGFDGLTRDFDLHASFDLTNVFD
jgi:hypothetical protein